MKGTKIFTIKYDVHCKLQNFFGKETIVKNCISELHAKIKLNDWCKSKYGIEFTHIIVTSCTEKLSIDNVMDQFNDIFGGSFSDAIKNKNQTKFDNVFDLLNTLKNKRK